MKRASLYFEIGQSSLKVRDNDAGLEIPLERLENGRLSPSSREKLSAALRDFLSKNNHAGEQSALCAIGARGVSLRRLNLPRASGDEFDRLLLLRIESEFPLSPDDLAWGYLPLSQTVRNGSPGTQELLVAAVKKELIDDYSEILSGCGLNPTFTVGAFARGSLCVRPPSNYSLLDIGRHQSELISFENGAPAFIRIIPWGGDNITQAIEKASGISHAQAEQLKIGSHPDKLKAPLDLEIASLSALLKPEWIGQKLYLTGKTALLKSIGDQLSKALDPGISCERLDIPADEGSSAAICGLRLSGLNPPLILQTRKNKISHIRTSSTPRKWAGLAALLLLASFSLRYAEGFLREKNLSKKVSEINAYKAQLPRIDRELSFLQYVQTNQPPYMDAILTIANAMPGGLRIDSLSMNRRGEVSLKGAMRDSQQLIDFRTKLIDSGFFSTVIVEEQSPTADRQKINYRITGQWKPLPDRKVPLAPDPTTSKATKTNDHEHN